MFRPAFGSTPRARRRVRPALALASLALLGLGPALAQEGLPTGPRRPGATVDLRERLEAALALVRDPERFHAGNALALLSRGYEDLFGLDPSRLDLERLDAEPEALSRLAFDLVLALDDRFAELHAAGQADAELGAARRRVLRGLRFLREQLLLRAAGRHPERLYAGGRPGFAARPPSQPGLERYHWTVNPAFFELPFRADRLPRTFFIINEGDMTLSAAIARSASEDNMFSHYSVVHVSEREQVVHGVRYPAGTLFTIEALIERGVVIEPFAPFHFEKALLSWSAREAVFFVRDRSKQAALDRAADAFFARALQAIEDGRPLGYDFTMGHGGPGINQVLGAEPGQPAAPRLLTLNRFFCSGVADALGEAAGVELFTHPSRMEQGENARALFVRWGVDPDRPLPAPGDGDVSAALVRVAEGVNLEKLGAAHMRHAVLERMFTWIDRDDYRVVAPAWFRAGSKAVTKLNDEVAGTILDLGLVPNGITPEIVQSLLPIHLAAEGYLKRLRAREQSFQAEHGRAMTPAEMAAFLEEVRPTVDVDRWFVRGAAGRYTLQSAGPWGWLKPVTVRLEVHHEGEGYRAVREVVREGKVDRAEGAGEQRGRKLELTFPGAKPERVTYVIERGGGIFRRAGPLVSERGRRSD